QNNERQQDHRQRDGAERAQRELRGPRPTREEPVIPCPVSMPFGAHRFVRWRSDRAYCRTVKIAVQREWGPFPNSLGTLSPSSARLRKSRLESPVAATAASPATGPLVRRKRSGESPKASAPAVVAMRRRSVGSVLSRRWRSRMSSNVES